jgi:hypothetical protein
MITVYDYMQKAKSVRDSILDEQERIVIANELRIIQMNTKNIDEGMGSDGNALINTNKKFTGFYTMSTNLLHENKRAGTLYNFFETGAFLSGFQVYLDNSLTKVNIFSTGTGSGEKADFFRGYKNIFGLDKHQSYELNYKIILPELNKFINQYL